MKAPNLPAMAFSRHPRYVDPRNQEKRATGPLEGLLGALLRQWRTYRLLQEKKRVWTSFCRVSAALGVSPDRQQQTAEQSARLARIREIETELRNLNYTDL